MAKSNNIKRLTAFFFEIGTLRKTIRAHRQTLLTDDLSDNIASHTLRCIYIGQFLAKMEKADSYKVMQMCLYHDLGESRCGDQNWIHKKCVKVFEEEISENQLKYLPESKDLESVCKEYQERKTKEAKLAKDADLLDQILLLREYEWTGNREATEWLKGREQEKLMYSKTAVKLAHEVYKQKPSLWWNNIWTDKRR